MPCGTQTSGSGWKQVIYEQINRFENGTSSVATSGPYDQSVNISSCSGVCTPNFRKRQAAGELLPLTPWSQYTINGREDGSYALTVDPPGSGNKTYTVISPFGSYGKRTDVNPTYWDISWSDVSRILAPLQYDSSVHAAASKIYTKVGHDTLTFLAELGKTKQMVLNTAKSMSRLAQRPGFRPDKYFRSVPGKWLEVRYGWRPLLYDLNDLSKATANLVAGTYLQRIKESSGYSDSGSDEETWTFSTTSTKVGVYERKTSYDVSVRGTVVADIKPPTFRFNPFATAWELVPYSFVMDWVVDIGSYIEAMSFLTIAQQYKAAGGYKFKVTRTLEKYPGEFNPYFSGWYQSHASNVFEGVIRHPTTVALTPSARVRLNEFKVVDLLTLVKQRLGFRR